MGAVQHETRKHALLSASGSSRWLNCTPSARLEEKRKESETSVYAQEGTLAHEFGDICLRNFNGEISSKVFTTEMSKLRKDKLYTKEMEPEVGKYINYVTESFNVARSKTPGAILIVEERLDFSHIVENGFGTGDACIIADGVLWVIDLKYGKGVRVEATNNPQLKLYGLGALRAFELMYDIHTVRLVVMQPRLDHISEWDISVDDLNNWGAEVVKPKALQAYAGKGTQKAGDWCRWCKVSGMCATLAAKNVALAKHDFKDPHLLSDEQLIDVFGQIPMLQMWAKSVSEHLLAEALEGKDWQGYKVVEGRSNRKWSDDEKAIKILRGKKFPRKDYINSKLKGIGDIQKLVGKEEFEPLLGEVVIKPPGKPTFVSEKDKRPAMGISQAKKDFEN